MLDNLSHKLQDVFDKLRSRGRLSESDVKEALREIKLVLLEADVNFKVVKDFIAAVHDKAVGDDILHSLTPGQHVIKVVHDELINIMGDDAGKLARSSTGMTVIMLVGLQGSGKTTTAAKLAGLLNREGRRPLLVAADIYRPAAVKQLQVLGESIGTPVFSMGNSRPEDIVRGALSAAGQQSLDTVIIDTAGRLHIDKDMMEEIHRLEEISRPQEILLVLDAAMGQEAVNVAQEFGSHVRLTGYIMSRFDSDTRGGAALSIRAVTGLPIKFIGVGEKLDALEEFHPQRIASRILGMGDVLTLIERAQAAVDTAEAEALEKKLKTNSFNFEDFAQQMRRMRKMGPLDQLLAMVPGFERMKDKGGINIDERQMVRVEAMIGSMTRQERGNPQIIDGSRRRRIASGSGCNVQEVNSLLKQFEQAKKMMKRLSDMEHKGAYGVMPKFPF
ncbi:MAG: signal recognition particle protein [bacterium]|nr:signal recognition particle protein [bacterium]